MMSMDPFVSIIMSEYNTDEYKLKKAIESILDQEYKNFEFIIVNDGKSNFLHTLLQNYKDERIVIVQNEKNIGLAKSLNRAIDASKGKYLVRMDTDDVSHQDRVGTLVNFMESNSNYSVVGSSINILTEAGKLIPKKFEGEIGKKEFLNRLSPVHPSVIMRKKDILDVGKYTTINVNRCEDLDLWGKLLDNDKKIYVISNILLDYRVSMDDYKKRKLSTRRDEIKTRMKYYKKFNATPFHYFNILKSVISGILPGRVMAWIQRH